MDKKYKIEAPIYSGTMSQFAKINQMDDISLILYGGIPDSPLNGGRPNFALDGIFLFDRTFLRVTEDQISRLREKFFQTTTEANKNNIPVYIAFTNIFVKDEEMTEHNLYPLQFLVESFQKYGVKNGIIVNNQHLEDCVRKRHGTNLVYVSSCTKYSSADKILAPRETQRMYQEDSGKYEYIVLSPQDSQDATAIKDVIKYNKSGIFAICNIICSRRCNSYQHHELFSNMNKKSLLTYRSFHELGILLKFNWSHVRNCPYATTLSPKAKMIKIIKMQLRAGVTNFKIGRSHGDLKNVETLVSLIQKHERGRLLCKA